MNVNFKASTSEEYFSLTEREIDWDENDNSKISTKQADDIHKILSTEVSIFLMRSATGFCGSLIDSMVEIRRDLINNYEKIYEPYVEYNDFY